MRSVILALCLALGLAAAAVTPDTSQLKQSCAQQLESAKGGEREAVVAMQDSCLTLHTGSGSSPWPRLLLGSAQHLGCCSCYSSDSHAQQQSKHCLQILTCSCPIADSYVFLVGSGEAAVHRAAEAVATQLGVKKEAVLPACLIADVELNFHGRRLQQNDDDDDAWDEGISSKEAALITVPFAVNALQQDRLQFCRHAWGLVHAEIIHWDELTSRSLPLTFTSCRMPDANCMFI